MRFSEFSRENIFENEGHVAGRRTSSTGTGHTDQGKLPKNHADSTPHLAAYPKMDSYAAYRASIALACYPNEQSAAITSVSKDYPMIASYSPIEHEAVKAVMKKMGQPMLHLAQGPSQESADVHKISPVANLNKPRKK